MQQPLRPPSVFLASLLVCIPSIAQAPPPRQAPAHAPDGGASESIQSISILPKPGAPFSATVVTEWTRMLEDGSTTTIKNHRLVARDSTGRIFQERRYLSPTGDKDETRLRNLQYFDATRHEVYNCVVDTRVCVVSAYNPPTSVPVALSAGGRLADGAGSFTREDLGQKTIANLEVLGSREIATISAGVNGYQHPEPTIKEFWYSPRLEVNLIVKRFEPRGGAENFALENITLSEPDPKLFIPPTGYRIVHTDIQ